jgi:hypothetical protein
LGSSGRGYGPVVNTAIETLSSVKDGNFYELSGYLLFRKYFATWS